MNEIKTFKTIDNFGSEKEFEILFTFHLTKTNKNYIVYTDNTVDEVNNTNIYAAIYYPSDNIKTLDPIETEEEWDEIEKLLQEFVKRGE